MSSKPALEPLKNLLDHMNQRILGQHNFTHSLLIALIANGHVLVEGPPGVAKTATIKLLATLLGASFNRIQFTPDLLPSDIIGSEIFSTRNESFSFRQGAIFHNIILTDEINRAPAKVQSALLEAMEEKQISMGNQSFVLPEPFFVMATQNPIDQEGTYPLPEAQLDRFLMKLIIHYPSVQTEKELLTQIFQNPSQTQAPELLSTTQILELQQAVDQIYIDSSLIDYTVHLVNATRAPKHYAPSLETWIESGASPRATIGLCRAACARALLHERNFLSPEDITSVFHDILRHRVRLTFEAQAQGIDTDFILSEILNVVAVG